MSEGQDPPPSRAEYEAAFDRYSSLVARRGGRVFAVERDKNELYTWAVELPRIPWAKARDVLSDCYTETFRDIEVAFAKATLGVTSD